MNWADRLAHKRVGCLPAGYVRARLARVLSVDGGNEAQLMGMKAC